MNLKNKLTSRKFWVALITIITGVLGVVGADDNIVQIIASSALALVPTIVYIFTEGKVDAAAAGSAASTFADILKAISEEMGERQETENAVASEAKEDEKV